MENFDNLFYAIYFFINCICTLVALVMLIKHVILYQQCKHWFKLNIYHLIKHVQNY